MYHYAYETCHIPSGEYYRGIHFGELDDSYLGSGDRIKAKLRKYPRSEFEKRPVVVLQDRKEARRFESRWVTQKVLDDPLCLNLAIGGSAVDPGNPGPNKGRKLSDSWRRNISLGMTGEKNHNFGKPKPEKEKRKLSLALKGVMSGAENPAYGKPGYTKGKRLNLTDEQRNARRARAAMLNLRYATCQYYQCGEKHQARGMCQHHYDVWRWNGRPLPIW